MWHRLSLGSPSNQAFRRCLGVGTVAGAVAEGTGLSVGSRPSRPWACVVASLCGCLSSRSSLQTSDNGSDVSTRENGALAMSPPWWAAVSLRIGSYHISGLIAHCGPRRVKEPACCWGMGASYLSLERVLNPQGFWSCSNALN